MSKPFAVRAVIALSLAFFVWTSGAAMAATTVLKHADGSRTEIVSNGGVAQVKVFGKNGKLVSKTVDSSFPKRGGHELAIQKYTKAGDTITTARGQSQ